ncbi:hypothetical protein SAMN05443579_101386 [Variovorax sp. PDC80]|uniref:hypothetical protein n=1 Tax=Variovorax sp. PDC80 TaxID=1882827 RepID=UPI0008E44A3D|nr:hypothetical protein [Variovorax sp. PDC80]SFO03784.1 hypothetical protein SAMN05443579_101386 [Variovorax sp. PDC80]
MHLALSSGPTRSQRALVFALAIALWLAGTLGLMHRSLHAPGLPAAAAAAAAHVDHDHAGHDHAAHGLAGLFGEHTDAECRLYDQLSHGSSAPGVPLVVLPMLLPTATFAYLQGEVLARWVALFDARGPPSSR